MSPSEKKFNIYLTILRFLVYKITDNLKRIYLDIDLNKNKVILTAFYNKYPSELEEELFDDICTNSEAHLPHFIVEGRVRLIEDYKNEEHDFVVFSVYEDF